MRTSLDKMRRRVLLDTNLAPVDKVVYLSMVEEFGTDIVDDLRRLEKYLQLEDKGQLKQLSGDRLYETFATLTNLGYLGPDGTVTQFEDNSIDRAASDLLNYVSDARIARGYSKKSLSAVAYRDAIKARLRDGKTLKECMAVVNFRFESPWHKRNHKFLLPSTLFSKKSFEDALSNIDDVEMWSQKRITKYGVEEELEDIIGEM